VTERIWRCFHCDEVFVDPALAARHFGRDETAEPGCVAKLDGADFGLLGYVRELEGWLASYLSETDAVATYFQARAGEADRARAEGEQKGYEKGLRDGQAWVPDERNLVRLFLVAVGAPHGTPRRSVRELDLVLMPMRGLPLSELNAMMKEIYE
jgi:hypothetical protein